LALLVLVLGACKDAPQNQASTAAALPYLPLPPQASFLSRSTSPNAVQITLQSGATPTEVVKYYRITLPATGWSLESDTEDAVGAYALYALKDGHPIWIRISQTPGMPGSVISLNGAVMEPPAMTADTAAGAPSGS